MTPLLANIPIDGAYEICSRIGWQVTSLWRHVRSDGWQGKSSPCGAWKSAFFGSSWSRSPRNEKKPENPIIHIVSTSAKLQIIGAKGDYNVYIYIIIIIIYLLLIIIIIIIIIIIVLLSLLLVLLLVLLLLLLLLILLQLLLLFIIYLHIAEI